MPFFEKKRSSLDMKVADTESVFDEGGFEDLAHSKQEAWRTGSMPYIMGGQLEQAIKELEMGTKAVSFGELDHLTQEELIKLCDAFKKNDGTEYVSFWHCAKWQCEKDNKERIDEVETSPCIPVSALHKLTTALGKMTSLTCVNLSHLNLDGIPDEEALAHILKPLMLNPHIKTISLGDAHFNQQQIKVIAKLATHYAQHSLEIISWNLHIKTTPLLFARSNAMECAMSALVVGMVLFAAYSAYQAWSSDETAIIESSEDICSVVWQP